MKYITRKQAERLAKYQPGWKRSLERCAQNWITENARYIAIANLRGASGADKVMLGYWPKGWKHEMNLQATSMAVQEWIDKNCTIYGDAIVLMNWGSVKEIEIGSEKQPS